MKKHEEDEELMCKIVKVLDQLTHRKNNLE